MMKVRDMKEEGVAVAVILVNIILSVQWCLGLSDSVHPQNGVNAEEHADDHNG